MTAIVESSGVVRRLDGRAEPDENVTEADAAQSALVAKLFLRLLKDVSAIKRRFWPQRIDFEDINTNTASPIRLSHGFGGRVRWWVVDQDSALDVSLGRLSSTDNNTLVLTSGGTSVVTIRVEEAG